MSTVPFPRALKAKPTLRQSLLGSFDNCALSTKFEMTYRKGWDSHPQGRGQLTHRTLARCLEEMHRQGETKIEVDVARAILHEVLRQEDVDKVCHEPGCDELARFLPLTKRPKNGKPLLCPKGHRHYSDVVNVPMEQVKDLYWIVTKWAHENAFDVANLIDVERRLEVPISYPNPKGGMVERRLTGQLDALLLDAADPSHGIVLDWKDTWALPPVTEVSFEGYFQQRFYALLVMRNLRNISKLTLREFYVRFSEPREVTIFREDLDSIEQEFSALAERFDRAFETNNWKPTPGKHCNFCPRPAKCPIPVFVRDEGRIIDADHAAKVAAQLLVAEIVVSKSKAALKAYVDVHGPVPVKDSKGTTVWGYEEYERTSRPSKKQLEDAVLEGKPLDSVYRTSKATRFGRITVRPGTTPVGYVLEPQWHSGDDDKLIAEMQASTEAAKKRAS